MKLTEDLGRALGPDYEVALYDLTDPDKAIIAIANRHVSGREVGARSTIRGARASRRSRQARHDRAPTSRPHRWLVRRRTAWHGRSVPFT